MLRNYQRLSVLIALFFVLSSCAATEQPQTNEGNDATITATDGSKESTNPNAGTGETDHQNPIVTIEMEDGGKIKAELYPDVAPNTVNNFISLIHKGFYDGLIFHRVIPGFMIQGGCPQGNGGGGPGYSIPGEFQSNGVENKLAHERGVLSMARTKKPNTAGSQFFIMVEKADSLDGQYAAFGKVIEGMDVVDRIVSVERGFQDKPTVDQRMKSVTVETFGVEYPEPTTVK